MTMRRGARAKATTTTREKEENGQEETMCPSTSSGATLTSPTSSPDSKAVDSFEPTQQPILVAGATIGPHADTSGFPHIVNKDGEPAPAPTLGVGESKAHPHNPPPLPAVQQAKESPAAQRAHLSLAAQQTLLTSAVQQSQNGVTEPLKKGAVSSVEDQLEEMRTSLKNMNATLALLTLERVERHKRADDNDPVKKASRNADSAAPRTPPNQEDEDEDADLDAEEQKISIYSNAISTLKLMNSPATSLQAEVLIEFLREYQTLKDELAESRRSKPTVEPTLAPAEEKMINSMMPALQRAEVAPKSTHLSAGPGEDRAYESLPKVTAIKAEPIRTASHLAKAGATDTDLLLAGDDVVVLTRDESRRLRKFTEP